MRSIYLLWQLQALQSGNQTVAAGSQIFGSPIYRHIDFVIPFKGLNAGNQAVMANQMDGTYYD